MLTEIVLSEAFKNLKQLNRNLRVLRRQAEYDTEKAKGVNQDFLAGALCAVAHAHAANVPTNLLVQTLRGLRMTMVTFAAADLPENVRAHLRSLNTEAKGLINIKERE